jgi:hypothetical protein
MRGGMNGGMHCGMNGDMHCGMHAGVSDLAPAMASMAMAIGGGRVDGEGGDAAIIPRPGMISAARVVRLLADFEEKCKLGDWPMSTSVHCYWCCHAFDNAPLGLPMRYYGGRFFVTGCFCSLECACAYNFHNFESNDSVDERLTRCSMLNALSMQLGGASVVASAPNRLSLKMFGGHMTIGEFRQYTAGSSTRRLIINSPPMQCVSQHLEEVSERDMASEYRYIPLDNARVTRYQERIRLSRTKPLINYKNTLDHSMKLKYRHHNRAEKNAA